MAISETKNVDSVIVTTYKENLYSSLY